MGVKLVMSWCERQSRLKHNAFYIGSKFLALQWYFCLSLKCKPSAIMTQLLAVCCCTETAVSVCYMHLILWSVLNLDLSVNIQWVSVSWRFIQVRNILSDTVVLLLPPFPSAEKYEGEKSHHHTQKSKPSGVLKNSSTLSEVDLWN